MQVCDHETYRDGLTGAMYTTCFCYCGLCYDPVLFAQEMNGCICDDCFCHRLPINVNCRAGETNLMYPDTIEKLPQGRPVETVVKDLPENPGKTGTCRKCKGPTFRKGDRGRFPVLCEGCK